MNIPDLAHSLASADYGHLTIIAELVGFELESADLQPTLRTLVHFFLDPGLLAELVDSLPPDAQKALAEIQLNQGSLPYSQFSHRYGEIRQVGTARRDREKVHLSPENAAEVLWYRGLIAKAFFPAPSGLQESIYIPSDLLPLLPITRQVSAASMPISASHLSPIELRLSNDRLLDFSCTLLSALRSGATLANLRQKPHYWIKDKIPNNGIQEPSPEILAALLMAAGILDQTYAPISEPTRTFLEMDRGAALAWLFESWKSSLAFYELLYHPEIECREKRIERSSAARESLLTILSNTTPGSWYEIPRLIDFLHENNPDLIRQSGDYEAWYLQDRSSGKMLSGFKHWLEIEGRLIDYFIQGFCSWFGLIDLGRTSVESKFNLFRLNPRGRLLLDGNPLADFTVEDQTGRVFSDGQIHIPERFPRAIRYIIARYCEWLPSPPSEYRYQITPHSLELARKQALPPEKLIPVLRKHSHTLPPKLTQSIIRWNKNGSEAKIDQVIVLKLRTPELLEQLKKSHLSRYIESQLGPTVVSLKPGSQERVAKLLAELGYLVDHD